MKFYRENKVNPFASCLPMVAQLPVFISLYYMLRTDLRHDICPEINPPGRRATRCRAATAATSSFLFIPDLTDKATGGVLVVLIVLYVGSQLVSTLLMSTTTDKTQRMIFLALPFFFVMFVIRFPAGLLVYWITTNLWTIVQQAIIRKRLGPLRPAGAGQRRGGLGDCSAEAARPAASRDRRRRRQRAGAPRGKRAASARRRASRRAGPPARRRRRRARRRSVRGGADERRCRPSASASCSSTSATRSALDADGRDRARTRTASAATLDGRRPRAVHRPPRPDDRRRPAPRVQGRRRATSRRGGRARRRRRRRLPRAARAGAAAPGRRGRGRRRALAAGPSRWTR